MQRKLPPVAPCVLDQLAGSTLQAGPTAGLQDLEDAATAAKDLGDTLAQVPGEISKLLELLYFWNIHALILINHMQKVTRH